MRNKGGSTITINAKYTLRPIMTKTRKKAVIFDLDNTIYSVSSIGEQLFQGLFNLIETDGRYQGDFDAVKEALQKQPFQAVAKEYHFHPDLTEKAVALLSDLSYNGKIEPFDDYREYQLGRHDGLLKFLVTTGFSKLQWSKIKQMELESDFDACFVVDPALSDRTKKDVFAEIMEKYRLKPEEVLVIGDDVHSEIKAGRQLGMDTVLYAHEGKHTSDSFDGNIITDHRELERFI